MRHGLRVQAKGLSLAIAADIGQGQFDSSGDVEEMDLEDAHLFCDAIGRDGRNALREELELWIEEELKKTA